ncbi:unnamed protein product, partial [Symbiodinium microadriaticum]
YGQSRLSTTFSVGAATTVLTQIVIFPRIVAWLGANAACSIGLLGVATGLCGFSLIWRQPVHTALYLLVRLGSGIADTSTATLVAVDSKTPEERARNLSLITSTRAAARIVTPMLSADLFEVSATHKTAPGALPYLVASSLAATLTPVPLLLKRKDEEDASEVGKSVQ